MTHRTTGSARPTRGETPAAVRKEDPGTRTSQVLDPAVLPDHIDALYRAAWALCGSRHDAEDLVQTTFAHVLKRRRVIRSGNERAYLLRALRNTYSSSYRTFAKRPTLVPLLEEDAHPGAEPARVSSRELMEAIASAPPRYRDAVIAVDIVGLSYLEAAHALNTGEATLATRVHRGRQHVARELIDHGV
jgi:RNA polymerase sigma-70 factor (ECF subfamily)